MTLSQVNIKPTPRAARSGKYKNQRVRFLGMKFDSIGERDRYIQLLQEQKEGKISNLQRQIKFPLTSNGHVVCHYVADFQYVDDKALLVVEDFKGYMTDLFQLKAKMFKACYGFDITITRRRTRREHDENN